ncbi:MAG: NmrA family NAD(P)-binding protein [Gemmatimonadaceae bacterium]|nr:NmrA family NAD(P)-binding protein [Gemmatimonadaceae bacterium]
MRVLVTGATGQVGGAVAEWVARLGGEVRRAVSRPAIAEDVRFDFHDRATWGPALAACDALFLLRPPAIADMATTLVPFAQAARAAGLRHVVFLSVLGAERMSWVPHAAVEAELRRWTTSWTILRPGFFAQNVVSQYQRDVVEDGRLYVPAGDGRVAWVDTRDLGEAAARVCVGAPPQEGRALPLTGAAALTFHETAAVLSRVIARPVRYDAASLAGYAWHLRVRRGLPLMQVAIQTVLHAGLRRGDAAGVDGTLGELLGRAPRSFEAFARDHAEAWRR